MHLRPNFLGQGPRTDRAAPGRRRSDPEVRVASGVAHQGAHGELRRSEPSSAVLASWATSTARFPEGSDPGLPLKNATLPASRGPATLTEPILHLMYLLRGWGPAKADAPHREPS